MAGTRAVVLLLLVGCSDPAVGLPDVEVEGDAEVADAIPDAALDADLPDVEIADAELEAGVADATPDASQADAQADAAPRPDAGFRPRPNDTLLLRFPVANADRAKILKRPVIGMDHDPATFTGLDRARCLNYDNAGFPFCYDEHEGSDFVLSGGFRAMDEGSAQIVAGAGGTVIRADDGNYDRCHADWAGANVSCDGNPLVANWVTIEHANGWKSHYLHFKKDSILVHVGDRVRCGDPLGLVGSSGNSSGPHVHIHVENPGKKIVDPYAGPASSPVSLWSQQVTDDGLPGETCAPAWFDP